MEKRRRTLKTGQARRRSFRRVRACLLLFLLEIHARYGVVVSLSSQCSAVGAAAGIAQNFNDEQRTQRRYALIEAMAPESAKELFERHMIARRFWFRNRRINSIVGALPWHNAIKLGSRAATSAMGATARCRWHRRR